MQERYNANHLFIASCLALLVTSMTFAIRAALIAPLGEEFGLAGSEMGWVVGTAFWGFTLAMIFGGPLVDVIGMKKILVMGFFGHVAGIVLTIFATGFWSLFISTLFVGIANGLIEAACNPLVATLYPDEKTKMLNRFHVWFPGGLVIGGLVAYFLTELGVGWQIQMATMLVPAIIYGIMFYGHKLPLTERVAAGVSTKEMFQACATPLFLFMVFCMLLSAATELGTNQWLPALLENVGVSAILVLVWISGIMAAGRMFAGPVVHKLSPSGVLIFSAVFSTIGLFWLSRAEGYETFAAATIFAIGITYFWPTMLGFVSENIPKSGALGLAVIGGAGMLSVSIILPFIGDIFDKQSSLAKAALQEEGITGTEEALMQQVNLQAGSETLGYMTILPLILIVAFTFLYFHQKRKDKAVNNKSLHPQSGEIQTSKP